MLRTDILLSILYQEKLCKTGGPKIHKQCLYSRILYSSMVHNISTGSLVLFPQVETRHIEDTKKDISMSERLTDFMPSCPLLSRWIHYFLWPQWQATFKHFSLVFMLFDLSWIPCFQPPRKSHNIYIWSQ